MRFSRIKAVLLMSVVFLLGAIAGASLGTAVVSRKFASVPSAASSVKVKFIDKMNDRLHLSPAQKEQLQAILEGTHSQFSALHESVRPQFEAIRALMRDRIREQLNPAQKQEFELMVQEYDKCRQENK